VSQPQTPTIPPAPQAPLQVGDALPTQRYDLAPVAPGGTPFRQQAAQPQVGAPIPAGSSRPFPTQGVTGQTSGYYVPQQPRRTGGSTMDLITIALAILAFFAVACLIPLYIAVFQAQFG